MTSSLRRRALLIGIETYDDIHFAALPSARADIEQLAQVLDHRSIGAFAEICIKLDLRADEMRQTIGTFLRDCSENELALLYISGHGTRLATSASEFFFIAADTDHAHIEQTAVGAGFLNECLEDCWATQKIAILDCCRSGGFALGFRTHETRAKAVQDQPETQSPLTTQGVYILASSGVGEDSFTGGGTVEQPEPSVFTAAIIETLRTGSAGTAASGQVSVDELFDAVGDYLKGARAPQKPVKSALAVDGRIVIANRPHGRAPELTPVRRRLATERAIQSESAALKPDWPTLLAYHQDAVQDEADDMPLLPVTGGPYVCLPGAERLLTGMLDEHGCTPAPLEAATFLNDAEATGLEIWTGWPAVVLSGSPRELRSDQFAPLLVRRVEVVRTEAGTKQLKPNGPVIPHPGLTSTLLDSDHAKTLAATYQPSWRAGESGRLADDAGHLLRDEFQLPIIEELRPNQLSDLIDIATPSHGARNVAILFTTPAPTTTAKLLKDFADIARQPHSIARTALGALLPPDHSRTDRICPPLVSPLKVNPAQRAVLRSAMTQRLTVATGPPGTGKTQLVVNAVATAIAAGQTVLVASTNNQAVNEVWQRCEDIMPGILIRTGSKEHIANEASGLRTLLDIGRPDHTLETSKAAHREALRRLEEVEHIVGLTAAREADLYRTGQNRITTQKRVGRNANEVTELLGPNWGPRARKLAYARLFGEWRRRRFLNAVRLPDAGDETSSSCTDIADLADLDQHWNKQRRLAISTQSDSNLIQALKATDDAVEQTSTELLRNYVRTTAHPGAPAIRALQKAQAAGAKDWREFRDVLRYVRGWALTCHSARRVPLAPALFDLVIIDEASQCSLPAVAPLLFRAKRALIIGDVMQLPHISTLSPQRDAELRRTHNLTAEWLDEHRMSVRRHSAFHAAERAAGGSLLLDEHYRCHPDIAAVSNELFYAGQLTVLTDTRGRPAVDCPPISWRSVGGRATRGHTGRSWYNADEAERVVECVDQLLVHLPSTATLGIVTPYRGQVDKLKHHLRARTQKYGNRIRIGTVHTFQGSQRDVIVLSLVASQNMPRGSIDWADHQHQLWNVAITRARSHLIIIGDEELWERRGGVAAKLQRAAHTVTPPVATGIDTELTDHLYQELSALYGTPPELGVNVHGHRADALVTTNDGPIPILLDPGVPINQDTTGHLRRMLRRRELFSAPDTRPAVRLPAWTLYDPDGSIVDYIKSSENIPIPREASSERFSTETSGV